MPVEYLAKFWRVVSEICSRADIQTDTYHNTSQSKRTLQKLAVFAWPRTPNALRVYTSIFSSQAGDGLSTARACTATKLPPQQQLQQLVGSVAMANSCRLWIAFVSDAWIHWDWWWVRISILTIVVPCVRNFETIFILKYKSWLSTWFVFFEWTTFSLSYWAHSMGPYIAVPSVTRCRCRRRWRCRRHRCAGGARQCR